MIDENADSRPSARLHPPQNVLVAAILGGPIAGGVVMALNALRLSRSGQAVLFLSAGVLLTGALLALPEGRAAPGIGIGVAIGTYYVAKHLQEQAVADHVARGGANASAWAAAGIGLVCLIGTLGLLFASFVATDPMLRDETVSLEGGDEVLYPPDVSREDAQRLADHLKAVGYFQGQGATVRLSREGERRVVTCVVEEGLWHDPSARGWCADLAAEVAPTFPGERVEVRLADEYLETRLSSE